MMAPPMWNTTARVTGDGRESALAAMTRQGFVGQGVEVLRLPVALVGAHREERVERRVHADEGRRAGDVGQRAFPVRAVAGGPSCPHRRRRRRRHR